MIWRPELESSLRKRVLDISKELNLSHIGSCLTSLPILIEIFKNNPERFVLSNGHAGLALYVLLEALYDVNAIEMFKEHGTHPCRSKYIDCSTGSLGMGLTVAVGFALAGKDTYCLISDGECAEGCVWEALAFKYQKKLKLKVYVNMNGWAAFSAVDMDYLEKRLKVFDPEINICRTNNGNGLDGLKGHYAKTIC